MPIRVLEPTVAAQIAAGEVVERPASVVKELLENALDAGARRIAVEVRGGGLRELKVSDDGCGIPADEVELAFERHATSKLRTADDLWAIGTLGFRGEALPSIAAVAQVVCVTRAQGEALGTELRIAGGELQARTAVGGPRGTSFSVRNLFYNVPVRREFLRSEATEAAAVAAVVTQYALAFPEVRMTLVNDGRLALQTSGSGDLRTALVELYGIETARQLLAVEATSGAGREAISIRGMVSPPGVTRSSRGYLHLFVNRRAIAPRGPIVYVIEEAYHTLLMKGRHPIAVLNLALDPAAVDVNIHPTKSEVKFRDTPRVHGTLMRAVRDALLAGGVRPWVDGEAPPPPDEAVQRRFELRRLGAARDGWTLPSGWESGLRGEQAGWAFEREREIMPPAEEGEQSVGEPALVEAAAPIASAPPRPASPARLPPLRVVGQVGNTYIIAESPDGMFLIDQHAAHERITYERLMAQRGRGPIERQGLLMPQTVDLPPAARQTLLEHAAALAEWGFEIEDFGIGLRVRAVPAGMRENDLTAALLEIADHLAGRGGSTPDGWREAMLTTLACHSSIRAGQALTPLEMRDLLEQLGHCRAPRTCPHGRPTMILLTTAQLERQFGRIA
jgi:DNA mismatch repair protein MutL